MSDYFRKAKSLYASTSNTFGTGTGETITPASVSGLPTDTEITLTFDRVDSSGTATPSAMERIIGTISGGNFVIRTSPSSGRGADGSTEQAHTSPVVEYIPNAKDINDMVDGFLVEHLQTGAHRSVTASNITASNVTASNITLNLGSDAQGDLYYRSSGGTFARLAASTSGYFLKTQGAGTNPTWADVGVTTDGWIASSDTWTYASATSFTISGVDRTSIYTKGTRIKLTQTTAKYFVVTSSSFSTNTTVNVTGGSDYSVANAAITSPYYSYAVNPQGYPTVFNYSPTFTGFSANPTNTVHQFSVVGNVCTVFIRHGSAGTSNATGFTMTIPITALTLSNAVWGTICTTLDNSSTQSVGDIYISSAGTTMTVEKAVGSANFTTSNGKSVPNAQIVYLI